MSLIVRIKNKLLREWKRGWLDLKYRVKGGPFFTDLGFMKLLYSGDGDEQEVLYHLYLREWYPMEEKNFSPHLGPGGCAVDVGANQGVLTCLFSRLAGERGRVFSFEPSPASFRKLSRTVAANRLANVELFNLGCGSRPGKLDLFHISRSTGNNTLRPAETKSASPREAVDIVALDDVLEARQVKIDLVKIDTEGFEDEVLRGAERLLRRDRPALFLELSRDYRASSSAAIALVKELGYRFTREPDLDASPLENFLALPGVGAFIRAEFRMDQSKHSLFGALNVVAEITGKKMAYDYVHKIREGDGICYISKHPKLKVHHPAWSITKSLAEISTETCER